MRLYRGIGSLAGDVEVECGHGEAVYGRVGKVPEPLILSDDADF